MPKGVAWSEARREAQDRGNVLRFWKKVDRRTPDECWYWMASIFPRTGYGQFRGGPAHRFSYELCVGPIPKGLQIDHLCRDRRCVNPHHLEAVTTRENLLRGRTLAAKNAAKTHCPKGHPYTPDNTYIVGKDQERVCKRCSSMRCREYQRRKRAAQG